MATVREQIQAKLDKITADFDAEKFQYTAKLQALKDYRTSMLPYLDQDVTVFKKQMAAFLTTLNDT